MSELNSALEHPTYNYKVVRQFAVMTVVWGIVGMLVGVLIAAQLVWPALNFDLPWLQFGLTAGVTACRRCGQRPSWPLRLWLHVRPLPLVVGRPPNDVE